MVGSWKTILSFWEDLFRGATLVSGGVSGEKTKFPILSELAWGILVRFDDQENQRRIVEENNRLDRYEALQIEAVTSGRKNVTWHIKCGSG